MTSIRLILSSLFHYRAVNLAVLIGVALTSGILSGALVVGDSVKESLRQNAASRISKAGPALVGGERFFTESLASRVAAHSEVPESATIAPLLQLEGTLTVQGKGMRLNRVQILGVTEAFWNLGDSGGPPEAISEEMDSGNWFALNEAAASRLGIGEGDRVIVRLEKPGALSRDAPLSGESEQTVPLSGKIDAVIDSRHFGRYSLKTEQIPPATVFVPLSKLQLTVDRPGQINVLLAGQDVSLDALFTSVDSAWNLADAELHLAPVGPEDSLWQLSTARVFLDDAIVDAATSVAGDPLDPVLTYLVNAIRQGDAMTPYSMVAATGGAVNGIVPSDLGPGEIIVTDWLAEDLGLRTGDAVQAEYFVVGSGRKLEEVSTEFTVRGIAPLDQPQIDPSWTPEFPGVLEVDSMDAWEPGIPIDNDRIRQKDDDYWDDYKATPKAFISIEGGKKLWGNRFGDTTSLRFPREAIEKSDFEAGLKERLSLGDLGWALRDLRAEADAAVSDSFDFGQLFAAMSFFLIVAALTLAGLVFLFGIEQRASQIGLLMSVGFNASRIRRLFLGEALLLSLVGSLAGLLGGWVYTRLALLGMSGAWQAAASGIEFVYHLRPATLAIAVITTMVLSLAVVWFASRAVTRVQPSRLISGGGELDRAGSGELRPLTRTASFWIGILSLVGGVACLFAPKVPGTMAEQGLFFGSGFLFTLAGVCACAVGLRALERPHPQPASSLGALGRQNAVRRKGRSLAVIGLMAAGVFMVTAINSFRLEGERGAELRSSGTGGFAFVGESTLPVYEDLNSDQGREKYGLPNQVEDSSWEMLQFRASKGDDASCLNLNRAQNPRLLAVDPERITALNPFSFSQVEKSEAALSNPWQWLGQPAKVNEDGLTIVPGIIDMNTATYALQKGLGDVIEYESTSGERFGVRLVGMLQTSILQGNIVIPESAFIEQFPSSGGYQYFLLDLENPDASDALAGQLTRMLGDRGLELIPAWQRLNEFNAVQNTYLSIFSTLGGLGLLLGTVGLAVVVSRNVLERRGQLGLMQAVGFTRRALSRMVLDEHWFLHVLGVAIGIAAALIAVLPKLMSRASDLPLGLLIGINAAILVGGLLFCALAARAVLRGSLVEALRSE